MTSFAEGTASYPGKTTAAQNGHNGDLEISSPGAASGAANMNPPESVGFSRGRRSSGSDRRTSASKTAPDSWNVSRAYLPSIETWDQLLNAEVLWNRTNSSTV